MLPNDVWLLSFPMLSLVSLVHCSWSGKDKWQNILRARLVFQFWQAGKSTRGWKLSLVKNLLIQIDSDQVNRFESEPCTSHNEPSDLDWPHLWPFLRNTFRLIPASCNIVIIWSQPPKIATHKLQRTYTVVAWYGKCPKLCSISIADGFPKPLWFVICVFHFWPFHQCHYGDFCDLFLSLAMFWY